MIIVVYFAKKLSIFKSRNLYASLKKTINPIIPERMKRGINLFPYIKPYIDTLGLSIKPTKSQRTIRIIMYALNFFSQ